MHLVDTHCHVDLYPDYSRVITEITQGQIETVAVTNTPSVFRRCVALTKECNLIHPALGLHPELVRHRHRELGLMMELLAETKFVGEVGLDFVTESREDRELQRRVFARILERCADHGDKILTVHSRRAASEVVAMIGEAFPGTVVLHWFSGSEAALQRAISLGCYFSINPAMLISSRGQSIGAALPRDKVLAETDGPFVRVDGAPATPHHVQRVVAWLASEWAVETSDAAETMYRNYRTALGDDLDLVPPGM